MQRRHLLTFLLAAAVASPLAVAHDPSKHKGKPIKGEVTSVGASEFTIATAKGELKVTFSEKTKFERGDAQASAADLKKGMEVTVLGTMLGTGDEVVAREVLLAPSEGGHGHQCSHMQEGGEHHHGSGGHEHESSGHKH